MNQPPNPTPKSPPPSPASAPATPPTPPEPEYVPVEEAASAPIQSAFLPDELEAAQAALAAMTPQEFILLKRELRDLKGIFPEAGGVAFTRMYTAEGAEVSVTAKSTDATIAGLQLQKAVQNLAEICGWTLARGSGSPTGHQSFSPSSAAAPQAQVSAHLKVISVAHSKYNDVHSIKARFAEDELKHVPGVEGYMLKHGVPAYGKVIPGLNWRDWPLEENYAPTPDMAWADVGIAHTDKGDKFRVLRFSAA